MTTQTDAKGTPTEATQVGASAKGTPTKPAAPAKTTKDGRFFTLPVITLIALSFSLGMSEFIIVGILPDIAEGLGVPLTTVGGLVSMFAFVYAPATPIGAAVTSRFERFHALAGMTVIFLIGNVLCALAPNYQVLLVSRVIIALVSGSMVAVAITFAPDLASDANRTRFVAWVFSGFSIASVFGVPVGTALANAFGWRWAFHAVNLLTVALLALMFAVLPKNHRPPRSRFLAQFFIFTEPRIWGGILAVLFGAAASYVFYTYLTPIMEQEMRVPGNLVSFGLSAYGIACLASNLVSGRLGARGRGVMPLARVMPIYLVQAVCLCLLPLATRNLFTGAALLLVLGFLMYLQNTPSQILYLDVAAATHPGSMNLASSFNSMSFNIGIACGSAVGGLVVDHVGMRWLGPFGALFALAAAVTVWWLGWDEKKRAAARAAK